MGDLRTISHLSHSNQWIHLQTYWGHQHGRPTPLPGYRLICSTPHWVNNAATKKRKLHYGVPVVHVELVWCCTNRNCTYWPTLVIRLLIMPSRKNPNWINAFLSNNNITHHHKHHLLYTNQQSMRRLLMVEATTTHTTTTIIIIIIIISTPAKTIIMQMLLWCCDCVDGSLHFQFSIHRHYRHINLHYVHCIDYHHSVNGKDAMRAMINIILVMAALPTTTVVAALLRKIILI